MLHYVKYALITFRSPNQHTNIINLLSIRIRFSVERRRRWRKLFTFSSSYPEKNWSISTKLGTHTWVKGIQVCSNEGFRPFPRGEIKTIFKNHMTNINQTWLKKIPWVKRTQVSSNEWPCPFSRGDNYATAKIH